MFFKGSVLIVKEIILGSGIHPSMMNFVAILDTFRLTLVATPSEYKPSCSIL